MKWILDSISPDVKDRVDVAAASTAVIGGVLADNLNEIALGLTILWTIIRIYEMETIQRIVKRKKNKDG